MSPPTPERKKRPRRPCPHCEHGLRRTHRRAYDRLRALFQPRLARYHCVTQGCGWEGLLPRPSRRASTKAPSAETPAGAPFASATRRQLAQGLAGAVALALAALLSAAAARWAWPSLETVQVGPHRFGPGAHHEGDPLPVNHPLLQATSPIGETDEVEPPQAAVAQASVAADPVNEEPLTLRRHCAWGNPGRDPYQGSVVLALRSARVPESVVQRIAVDVQERRVADRVSISRKTIRADASGRRFDPRKLAMTYGRSLCVDTRVNFGPGHVERADLYEAADEKGQVYAVMVPDVCGNVSVLSEVAEDDDRAAADAAKEEGRSTSLRRLPQALVYDDGTRGSGNSRRAGPGRSSSGSSDSNAVSAPTTLACTVIALGAAAWLSRRRRRGVGAVSTPESGPSAER